MARKRAGDFLNILSDPEKSSGLLAGSTPIMLKAGQPARQHHAFPGIIGLGAVSGTGVAPKQRQAMLDDDGESGGGKFRMDLALAALLGLLVTNIVSFTLGARAGRQAVGPETTTTLALPVTGVTSETPLFNPDPAPAVAAPAPVASQSERPAVEETGPIGSPLSAPARVAGRAAPATPTTATAATAAPSSAVQPPAAPVSLDGKYVVRLITLRYDAHRQALAQKIKVFMESSGFSPCTIRTSNGKLVVEVGAFEQYRSADAAKAKIRTLKCGHERFDSAYVVQRTK